MLNKIAMVIIAFIFFSNSSFAINRDELNMEFFSRFNDEYLVQYINQAFENNHDAKQAGAKVEQYRQNMKTSLSSELPSFSVSAAYLGVNVPRFSPNLNVEKNAFVLPFIANYEADFLLKNRDKTKSSKKMYEISLYDEKTVYLVLLSDVATVYVNILQYDKLIDEQQKLLANLSDILASDTKKYNRGIISSTEKNKTEVNYKSSQVVLENLIKSREISLMQLAVLIGKSPDDICDIQRGDIENFEYSGIIPSEIESDVIFSRPDVKSAEAMLEKAKIDVRVARKEFLPAFNIVGIWAFNTIAPGNFFSWESSLASILAGATQDIFTGGRKIANLKYQKAKYEELFELYRQTDLNAVKEVNTALCFTKHDFIIESTLKDKKVLDADNMKNSDKMLARGIISYGQYLNNENDYLNADMDYIKAKTQKLVNYFTLYKAAGGNI